MAFLRNITRMIAALALVGFLAGCEPPADYHNATPTPEGTTAIYKISGHLYDAEVTHAKDGYVAWSYTWKGKPVFELKSYRGILSVYQKEEGYKSWSKFDPAVIDALFPLDVGKEAVIEGHEFSESDGSDFPFSVTVTVTGKAEIKIKGAVLPVFVLDYVIVEERPNGNRIYTKKAWFSEDLETAIRADYIADGNVLSIRMISLNQPDGAREDDNEDPEGIGTIRL